MHTPTITNNAAAADGNGKRATVDGTVVRLLSLKQAGAYLGTSYWHVRDLVIDGILRPVRLPGSRLKGEHGKVVCHSTEHSMRKIMVDREDLDKLVSESKG